MDYTNRVEIFLFLGVLWFWLVAFAVFVVLLSDLFELFVVHGNVYGFLVERLHFFVSEAVLNARKEGEIQRSLSGYVWVWPRPRSWLYGS